MLKRYGVLIGFATVAIILLILDDPAKREAQRQTFSASQQAQRERILFSDLTERSQITGIDVLDVTTGKGILVLRNEEQVWYAPEILDIQDTIPAENIDQDLVEGAAAALLMMQAEQAYEATPENFELFGLQPQPSYRARFQARDQAGQTVEATLDIGDTNPDNVAYYVYVLSEDNQRIFLISKQTVDLLLDMLTESIELAPTLDTSSPMDSEVTTPVP